VSKTEKIAVLRAGLMGHGIAQLTAQETMLARHSLNQGFEMISRGLEFYPKKTTGKK
jgi:3-hydroxyacyl-CoA dehydrogenase